MADLDRVAQRSVHVGDQVRAVRDPLVVLAAPARPPRPSSAGGAGRSRPAAPRRTAAAAAAATGTGRASARARARRRRRSWRVRVSTSRSFFMCVMKRPPLTAEHEARRRLLRPRAVVLRPLQGVERAVDLDRREPACGVRELAPLRQPLRVEVAAPRRIAPAGDADVRPAERGHRADRLACGGRRSASNTLAGGRGVGVASASVRIVGETLERQQIGAVDQPGRPDAAGQPPPQRVDRERASRSRPGRGCRTAGRARSTARPAAQARSNAVRAVATTLRANASGLPSTKLITATPDGRSTRADQREALGAHHRRRHLPAGEDVHDDEVQPPRPLALEQHARVRRTDRDPIARIDRQLGPDEGQQRPVELGHALASSPGGSPRRSGGGSARRRRGAVRRPAARPETPMSITSPICRTYSNDRYDGSARSTYDCGTSSIHSVPALGRSGSGSSTARPPATEASTRTTRLADPPSGAREVPCRCAMPPVSNHRRRPTRPHQPRSRAARRPTSR